MKRLLLFAFLLLPLSGLHAQQVDSLKESKAITALVQRYEDAWNRHDPEGLAAQYTEDATWVNWFGAYYKGREDIKSHYATVHTTYFRQTHYYTRSIEDITFITPAVAVAHVRTGLTGDERFPGKTFEFRRMIVLKKEGSGWHIFAGQNAKLEPGVQ